jgi:hypothetical protein
MEVLSLPLLNASVTLEVAQVLQVELLTLGVELLRTFFSSGDDRFNVIVDHHPERHDG